MNEQNTNNGERPEKKRRGCPPGGWPKVKKGTDEYLKIGSDESDREQNLSLRLSMTVPPGPYKTQAERWECYRKILDLQTIRDMRGMKGISEASIEKHVGVSYLEFEREIYSTPFQNYRLAKASMAISGTLADIVPSLRIVLLQAAEDIRKNKGTDDKKKREFINTISNVMEKFGIQKIDVSHADSSQEMDVDEAIEEGMRIVNELKGREEVVQWFTKVATEPHGRRDKIKVDAPIADSGTSKDNTINRPDSALEAIQLRETVVDEQEKVSLDGGMQPS